jgi:NADH-quinone oxidoreductase subunit G
VTTTQPDDAEEQRTGVPFTLNGTEVRAEEGELLIDACERNGVHIPRFCYHSRMEPVGMCRMCLVEVDAGRGPNLQPSCMLPVTPDMRVETESEMTRAAQDGVLELLLTNHPLDCPVCDKGGECPLQDNAYSYGPGESRFVEEKRHYEKPIVISDLVHLDRERCILCDRCTRFAADVAGDPLIHFIDRGSQTQVNTFPDHPFSSYFSGNTVQICPVGALTASPYRFKARPWDLAAVESTATVDTSGARVVLQSSRNELVRVLGVDSDAVNWGWLSDKERFSYESTTSPDRITEPRIRPSADGDLTRSRWSDATEAAARALAGSAERIAVLGGARMALEGQYAWSKLLKCLIGTDHIDCQLGDGLPAPLALGLPRATINDACQPGGVVVLIGPDPKEEVPTLYLRLRHAVVKDGVALIELTPRPTSLSKLAAVSIHPQPGTLGQLAGALAGGPVPEVGGDVEASLDAARALLGGDRPVTVILGRGNLAESARYTADAVGAVLRTAPEARFLPTLRRGNVFGALEMGLTGGFLPGGVRRSSGELPGWQVVPEFDGRDADGILRAAAAEEIDTLILLGADPINDFPDASLARDALETVTTVIAVDAFSTASTALADVFLPAALFGEVDGTFCNLEGRLSPLRAKVTPPGQAKPDWAIAAEVAQALELDLGLGALGEIRTELSTVASSLAGISWDDVESADDGPLIELERQWVLEFGEPADPPALPAGGLRMLVDRKLWDQGTMVQQSASLAGLPADAVLRLAPADAERLGLSTGDRAVVDRDNDQLDVKVAVDAAVPAGTAWLPFRLPGFDVRQLLSTGRSMSHIVIRPGGEA